MRNRVTLMAALTVADVRFAVRTLFKTPGFLLAVVTTMSLGIGTTISMFAVVNSIVLRPLPFPESERVVMVCETNPRAREWCVASPPNVADWADGSHLLESAGVARAESFIARNDEGSSGVQGGIATPGFFRVLRVTPMLGRLFEDGDLNRGSNGVVLVSHAFWRRALQGDRAVIGRTLTLDGRVFTVVGVLPADAYVPGFPWVEVWKPLTASIDNVDNRAWRGFTAIARRGPGVSLPQLRAELQTIAARLSAAYPDANAGWGINVVQLRDRTVGPTRTTLWTFVGATAFVLLIACANVAGLLLVRATRRTPEFAVRTSLGAGRARLVRQLLTESLVLSLLGGAAGLLLALWTTRAFVLLAPTSIPRLDEVSIDGRVAFFAVLLSAVTAILFGLVPARQASSVDLADALKGRRHGTGGETRLRSALVIAEMALALVLLVGAGLMVRALDRVLRWDPGFSREGLATSWLLAPADTYRTTAAAVGVLERARDAIAGLPGMHSAALASGGPLFGGVETGAIVIEGAPPIDQSAATVNWFDVSPEYFDVVGIATVKGRTFHERDVASGPHVAVINQSLATRFFGTDNPIGRRVRVMKHASEIVGIVRDIRPYRPDLAAPPEIYWPIRQYPRRAAYLVMRAESGPSGQSLRARVAGVDPAVQVSAVVSLNESFSRVLVTPRFNALLLGAFALVALALATVGIAGVIAYSVASRTREIGIRIALGATSQRLVTEVVSQGMTLAALGMALGIAGSLALGRVLATMLYGLPSHDWVTLGIAIAVFAAVAFCATYVPARRAAHIDPLTALRQD